MSAPAPANPSTRLSRRVALAGGGAAGLAAWLFGPSTATAQGAAHAAPVPPNAGLPADLIIKEATVSASGKVFVNFEVPRVVRGEISYLFSEPGQPRVDTIRLERSMHVANGGVRSFGDGVTQLVKDDVFTPRANTFYNPDTARLFEPKLLDELRASGVALLYRARALPENITGVKPTGPTTDAKLNEKILIPNPENHPEVQGLIRDSLTLLKRTLPARLAAGGG